MVVSVAENSPHILVLVDFFRLVRVHGVGFEISAEVFFACEELLVGFVLDHGVHDLVGASPDLGEEGVADSAYNGIDVGKIDSLSSIDPARFYDSKGGICL